MILHRNDLKCLFLRDLRAFPEITRRYPYDNACLGMSYVNGGCAAPMRC
jgi:hypothetical protein